MTKNEVLTQERLLQLLHYDPDSGVFRWKVDVKKSRGAKVGKVAGCVAHGYVKIKIDQIRYPAHRLAWLYMTGEWPRELIDHKDRNRSNNRWANLRQATHRENSRNQKGRGKFGLKGVRQQSRSHRFAAQIAGDKGKKMGLGTFDTPEEAHAAYCKASAELHGEFGRTR